MARVGRRACEVELTVEERRSLEDIVRRGSTPQSVANRARVALRSADGASNKEIAEEIGLSKQTVGKWRSRFAELGLDGLNDSVRPGAPRGIDDEKVAELVKLTLETAPKGASRWSTRDMAKATGVGRDSVSRIWRAFGLKPHRPETFQLSSDPFFVEKVRDVVGLYMHPPDNALVLSVDEKSQIQALNRTQPVLPLRPGQLELRTPEYQRNGTTTLFAALDVATGTVLGKCFPKHRAKEFIAFLKLIDRNTPKDLDLHLVLDNYATHRTPEVKAWLLKHPRFHLHFTPTHASWLNQVEGFFGQLTEKQLKRGNHFSARELITAIDEYLEVNNKDPRPFKWTKTANEIIEKVGRLCFETLTIHAGSVK